MTSEATVAQIERRIALRVASSLATVMWSAIMAGLAILPLAQVDAFMISIATTVLITAIAAASLHLIIRMGHVSLAHAAFAGIGAYAAVIAAMRFGVHPALTFVAAFAAPALVAALFGPILLRLTGKYFVLGTFMFGEMVRLVLIDWRSVTNGAAGILGIPPPGQVFATPISFYYLALGFAVACIGLCYRILSSEIGRAMDSLREGEAIAKCSGIPGPKLKVIIFVIACGLAGIAGALQAYQVKYIDPGAFSSFQSLNLVVMNVIGSLTNLAGTLVGVVFIVLVPEFLRDFVAIQRILFGVVLIVVMAFLPGGLVEIAGRLAGLWRKGSGDHGSTP
jgi:branched-chain amino acid transport system permease protein